jgi:osmotically inducible lipoprotein OsmB
VRQHTQLKWIQLIFDGLGLLPYRPARHAAVQMALITEPIMKTVLINTLGATALALPLTACSGMSGRDKNTAARAAIGGAAVGGVIGNQVDPHKK